MSAWKPGGEASRIEHCGRISVVIHVSEVNSVRVTCEAEFAVIANVADARTIDVPRGCNSVVECQLPKLNVAGSNPVARF